MKIVCVCNICEESIIIKSFGEVINNNNIIGFNIDDCLLADTLFDLLNHLDTYTAPAATPQVINTRKAIHPLFLSVPTYTVPITSVVVASVYTTSVVIASVVTAFVFTTPVLTTSALTTPTSILSCSGSDSTSPIACDCSFSSAEF
ncbi:hypothetical protein V2W45_237770 [Cenococcum geophilum]